MLQFFSFGRVGAMDRMSERVGGGGGTVGEMGANEIKIDGMST